MNEKHDLTRGNMTQVLLKFAVPYLLACFMQTFYGMADLFVVGLYNGAATTTAVSIGSQITHMLTVIIVGAAMGATVRIGMATGAKDAAGAKKAAGTTIVLFAGIAAALTLLLLALTNQIVGVMSTPVEAVSETRAYLLICFAGVPFITAYNVISSIFRGAGDSRHPMYFVAIACVTNIALDFLFIGALGMGATGAALGTVLGQALSSVIALVMLRKQDFGFKLTAKDVRVDKKSLSAILKVGLPIALQDGLIQIAFVVITIIANSRGLIDAAGVGIVEKLISFMFLVPSAFLSAISAAAAQNMGAGKPERARRALRCGLVVAVCYGCLCCAYNQFLPHTLVGLFTRDGAVLAAGCEYMKSYVFDCIFAGIHFCFSGYFCGIQKSGISFIHNIASIILVRIPGAYLASVYFPHTLYPMGWAAPLGSLLSACICVAYYVWWRKRESAPVQMQRN